MTLFEIIVLIISALIVVAVIISGIITRKKGKTACGDCKSCKNGNCHKRKEK